MFGLFKEGAAPEGPVEIETKLEIATSAENFFALINFADPCNAQAALGHKVEQIAEDEYHLVMTFLPDLKFEIHVEEHLPPERYMHFSPMPEGVGRLLSTRETYRIERTGENSCNVVIETVGEFEPGMTMTEFEGEVAMFAIACENSAAKLKVHAEGGIGAVLEFEQQQAA